MSDKELTQLEPITSEDIKSRIYTIRGVQVMLDSDLAELYQVETFNLNKAVKRNIERFPVNFCFQLTNEEYKNLRFQIGISNVRGGRRYNPYVFTEQRVAMLAGVLHSDIAVKVSISIMNVFVAMRHYLADNAVVFQRLDRIELKQIDTDNKINQIFKQLEQPREDKAIMFFSGKVWDATNLIEKIVEKAKESINLIDNYTDRKTLELLTKKKKKVTVKLYTSKNGNKITEKEVRDFNSQYGGLSINYTDEFHDRFIILDRKILYHCGASLKDAGKKAFEISLTEDEKILEQILKRLEE